MKKRLKFGLALIVGFLIFYAVLSQTGVEPLERSLRLFLSPYGLVVIGLTVLAWLIGVFRWKVILGCQGEKRRFADLTAVWTVGFTIDYLTPVSMFGGEALRVYLTGKTLDIDWDKSFSSVIIDKILDGTFHVIFITVGVLTFLSFGNFPELWILWLVAAVIFFLFSVLALFYSRAIGKKSILLLIFSFFGLKKTEIKATKKGEFIFNTEGNVLRFFSPSESFFWKGVMLSFLRHSLFYMRAFFLVYFLTQSWEPFRSLAMQGLAYLALFLPLPAGLGGLEAISGFGMEVMGMGADRGVAFGMTWRAAELVICILGVIFALKIGLELFKLKTFDFIDRVKGSD